MNIMKIAIVAASLLLLSGCEMSSGLLHSEGKMPESSSKAQTVPKQNCNQWCHNGWCSTHCEDVVNS